MKIAIVTDSTAYLTKELENHPDVYVIPIPIILDGEVFYDGIDIQTDNYLEKLKNSKQFPTTSQPALGEIIELYQRLENEGYDHILSIHLSSGISGLLNTLATIQSQFDTVKIYPYDSLITSMPLGYLVETGLRLAKEGKSMADIIQKLDFIRDHTSVYIILDDLNNLVRGGRLTNGAAIIGGMLKIKPILTFDGGQIVLFEKIRSTKKAILRIEELIQQKKQAANYPVKFHLIHSNQYELAESTKEKLNEQYPDTVAEIGELGPVIGTHLGDKAFALVILPV